MRDGAKKIIFVSALLVLTLFVFLIVSSVRGLSRNVTLTTEAAPLDSKITINENRAKNGINKVKPGKYQIVFSRTGFGSETHTLAIQKNDKKYLGVVLMPHDPSYANWYFTHPKDAKMAENISSHTFDTVQTQQLSTTPVLKYLPLIQPTYRIDSGISKKYPNDPTKIALYVSTKTDADKQAALDWLKAQGADPSKLEIIYQLYSY